MEIYSRALMKHVTKKKDKKISHGGFRLNINNIEGLKSESQTVFPLSNNKAFPFPREHFMPYKATHNLECRLCQPSLEFIPCICVPQRPNMMVPWSYSSTHSAGEQARHSATFALALETPASRPSSRDAQQMACRLTNHTGLIFRFAGGFRHVS